LVLPLLPPEVGTTSPDITSTSPLPSVVALGYQRLPLVPELVLVDPMLGTLACKGSALAQRLVNGLKMSARFSPL
jgi:hypothetical protein